MVLVQQMEHRYLGVGNAALVLFLSAVGVAAGCGGTSSNAQPYNAPQPGGGSSGSASSSGAAGVGGGWEPVRTQTIGSGIADCGTRNTSGLQMLPDQVGITTFSFLPESAQCYPFGMGLLLKNLGSEPIEVRGIGVGPKDFGVAAHLPTQLDPNATLPVVVDYTGANTDGAEGTLTVSTSVGCFDFRVRGLAATERLMTYTDRAIDFGAVAPGTTSAPHTVSLLFQSAPGLSVPTVEAFSASPEDLFELTEVPSTNQPVACQPIRISVRFKAPEMPGDFEGALLWRVLTVSPEGTAEGTVFIPLYGTSR